MAFSYILHQLKKIVNRDKYFLRVEKRYNKAKKERKMMFFRKSERKRRGVGAILTIGALAAIGAVNITRSGKRAVNNAVTKVKDFFMKEKSDYKVE